MSNQSLGVDVNFRTNADTRSLEDLNQDLRVSEARLRAMRATDPGWQAQAAQVSSLRTRIAELNAHTRAVAGAQNNAARSSVNMGQAMMQGSRAAQDFQAAGLNGMVNNIESVAMALGGGTGLAGTLTLLLVGLQVVGPKLGEWFSSLDAEGKKVDELKEKMQNLARAVLGDYSANKDNARRITEEFTKRLEDEVKALEKESDELEHQLDLFKQRQDIQKDADTKKMDSDIANVKERTDLTDAQKADAIAMIKADKARLDKQREDAKAKAEVEAGIEKTNQAASARDEAKARREALEKEYEARRKYGLVTEQIYGNKEEKDGSGKVIKPERKGQEKTVEDARAAMIAGQMVEGADHAELERQYEEAKAKLERLKAEAAALKNAMPNGVRNLDVIGEDLGKSKTQEKGFDDKAKAEADELRRNYDKQQLDAVKRENDLRRELEAIERERRASGGTTGELPPDPATGKPPLPPVQTLPDGSPAPGPAVLPPDPATGRPPLPTIPTLPDGRPILPPYMQPNDGKLPPPPAPAQPSAQERYNDFQRLVAIRREGDGLTDAGDAEQAKRREALAAEREAILQKHGGDVPQLTNEEYRAGMEAAKAQGVNGGQGQGQGQGQGPGQAVTKEAQQTAAEFTATMAEMLGIYKGMAQTVKKITSQMRGMQQ